MSIRRAGFTMFWECQAAAPKGHGKPFILEDKVRNVRKAGWFDSKIAYEGFDECAIDIAFRFLEARL